MQIAVVNRSGLPDLDLALMTEACNAQVIEAAAAWGTAPTPVVFYSTTDGLPAVECRIMLVLDSLDVKNALGFHTNMLGSIYGRVLNQGPVDTCVTLSHECVEMLVDPTCTGWRSYTGTGREVALEACDAVQGCSYAQQATVLGISRDMWLSNYVTPEWFNKAGVGKFDRMQVLSAPLTMAPGGYLIIKESDGDVVNVFAMTRPGDAAARNNVADKVMRPGSRTIRRLRGWY